MKFKLLALLGFSLLTTLATAQNDDTPINGANIPGNLSDGALVLENSQDEKQTIDGESSAQESLPVAENVDLKEIVVNEQLGAIPESTEPSTQPGVNENKPATLPVKQADEHQESGKPLDEESSNTVATDIADENVPTVNPTNPIPKPSSEESSAEGSAETGESTAKPSGENSLVVSEAEVVTQPSLRLLASEVLPGTSARLAWEPSVAFMGISAPTAVLVVNGIRQGPTLCLTSAVHGDELNGIEMVRHILYNIDPQTLSGAIIGVPIVNLQGFRRSSRYLPDRRDLNRYFPGNPNGSAASRIAFSFFDEVVRHCDMLVDIHTGSFKRTNLPQLRADLAYKKVADLAGKMGSIVVVQSRGHSGSLRRASVEYGVPAVTLEAGEPHILDKEAVSSGIKSIQTLLHAEGMAKTLAFWELRRGPVYYKSRWVRSVNGGILFSDVGLGANVKEGDVLGTVTDPITNLSTDIVSPHNGKVIGMALNQVLYPGYAAYHIGLQAPAQEAAEDAIGTEPGLDMSEDGSATVEELEREQESEAVMEVQILEDSE